MSNSTCSSSSSTCDLWIKVFFQIIVMSLVFGVNFLFFLSNEKPRSFVYFWLKKWKK